MTRISAWFSRYKGTLIAAAIPILAALWWAFRPEKLWVNQTVNEAAPFTTAAAPEPLFTGQFDGTIGGRATVFKKSDGSEYLGLKDLTVPGGAEAHVELATTADVSRAQNGGTTGSGSIDLGALKTGPGDQKYDLPKGADLSKYDVVAIWDKRADSAISTARLQPF